MLSKKDVQALKLADRVSFHSDGKGAVTIVCTKNPTDRELEKNPFAQEMRYDIAVVSRFEDSKEHVAFAYVGSAQYSEEWQTVASFLREGDEIKLIWSIDGWRNQYIEEAGLHADVLFLRIQRGEKKYSFHIDHCVCPDNSARMIK